MRGKGVVLLVLALLSWLDGGFAPAATRYEEQVVRVHSAKREVDPSSPWQSEDAVQHDFLGTVLPGGEVLTTAFAVADAVYLEVQRFGVNEREEAAVIFVDYEVNLALIKPLNPAALAFNKPVLIGDDLAVDDSVDIYKVRDSHQLSRIAGSLQDASILAAATSIYGIASYSIKVQQTALGWAEPVFQNGKLVGLTTGQDQNFLFAVPASVLKHFLSDHHDATYRGFPAMGVQLEALLSPDTRRLLGAPSTLTQGVRVAEVQERSAFVGKLQTDDIILAVDGVAVSDQGLVSHPSWGQIHLKYLVTQHYSGDPLTLRILRRGQELTVTANLQRFDSNTLPVISYRYGQPERHLILGGLVFEELSQAYLKQWGKEWRETAPVDLLFPLGYANKPTSDAQARTLFLTRVLADPVNRGYTELRHKLVAAVNGTPVNSLATMRQALAQPILRGGAAYARITLAPEGEEVILAMKDLAAAHKRMARTYEINTPASFYTP